MSGSRVYRIARQIAAAGLSAALVLTTTPPPPAYAFLGGGGGGGNPLSGILDGMSPPGTEAPAEAEGESPSTEQTAPAQIESASEAPLGRVSIDDARDSLARKARDLQGQLAPLIQETDKTVAT